MMKHSKDRGARAGLIGGVYRGMTGTEKQMKNSSFTSILSQSWGSGVVGWGAGAEPLELCPPPSGLCCLPEKHSVATTTGTPKGASMPQNFPPCPLEPRAAVTGAWCGGTEEEGGNGPFRGGGVVGKGLRGDLPSQRD